MKQSRKKKGRKILKKNSSVIPWWGSWWARDGPFCPWVFLEFLFSKKRAQLESKQSNPVCLLELGPALWKPEEEFKPDTTSNINQWQPVRYILPRHMLSEAEKYKQSDQLDSHGSFFPSYGTIIFSTNSVFFKTNFLFIYRLFLTSFSTTAALHHISSNYWTEVVCLGRFRCITILHSFLQQWHLRGIRSGPFLCHWNL